MLEECLGPEELVKIKNVSFNGPMAVQDIDNTLVVDVVDNWCYYPVVD